MNNSYKADIKRSDYSDANIAIVSTDWNSDITNLLAQGAEDTLRARNAAVERFTVPGAIELTYAAQRLADSECFDAIIVCGCVIKGDTPHFDYVCQSVTQGVTSLNTDGLVPVIFCVLTVLDRNQAVDRCGGSAGHKGIEAAETALAMIDFNYNVNEL